MNIGTSIVGALSGRSDSDLLLVDDRGEARVGDLHHHIESLAATMLSAGLQPSCRMCVIMPNDRLMAMTLLASMCLGSCAPVDPRLTEAEFASVFDGLDAQMLITTSGFAPAARRAARLREMAVVEATLPTSFALVHGIRSGTDQQATRADSALLLHTSGTTARPKLVGLTEANLLASARSVAHTARLGPTDRCLGVMPLFHIHGLVGVLLASLVAGSTVELVGQFDPADFRRRMSQREITWTSAVPGIYRATLARSAPVREAPLRFLRSGSAPLPTDLWTRLEDTCGCPIVNAYGMTEASHQMTSTQLTTSHAQIGTVGLPAGADVAILTGRSVTEGPGPSNIGEVVVRGPGVIDGYLTTVDRADTHVDGWFRTGDLGSLGPAGDLTLVGRIKEMINVAGEKVSPFEVEEVLSRHPAVEDVAAFAISDRSRGEHVGAVVVLRTDVAQPDDRDLRRFAAEQLAAFKVPRRIVVAKEIPVGPTGKVQRNLLADRLGLDADLRPLR